MSFDFFEESDCSWMVLALVQAAQTTRRNLRAAAAEVLRWFGLEVNRG